MSSDALFHSHPWRVVLNVHALPLRILQLVLLLDAMTCALTCWSLCSRSGQILWVFQSAGCYLISETWCSRRQPASQPRAWLINKSESRGLTLLGILSPFTRARLLQHLHIAQRAAQWRERDRWEGGGGVWSCLWTPEALHMKISSCCFLCACYIPLFFWKQERRS